MKSKLLIAAMSCVLFATAALAAAPDQAHIISPPSWESARAPRSTQPYALTGNLERREARHANPGWQHEVRRLGPKAEYDVFVR